MQTTDKNAILSSLQKFLNAFFIFRQTSRMYSNCCDHMVRSSNFTSFSIMMRLAFLSGNSRQSRANPITDSVSSLCNSKFLKSSLSSFMYNSTSIQSFSESYRLLSYQIYKIEGCYRLSLYFYIFHQR